MNNNQEKIMEILMKRGDQLLNQPYTKIEFTENPQADELLNDIEKFPHAFVLACIMDRQIRAERAWMIPSKICQEIGSFDISKLLELNSQHYMELFRENKFHRFNDIMAKNFHSAIQKIHHDYNGDASLIWNDSPRSATIVRKLLEFEGVGVKIATMGANILAREFKIPMEDHFCIDISPDVHVKRVFRRIGFISKNASNEEIIYSARELNPEYPGIFDLSCWEIGRNWCKPKEPKCQNCYLNDFCDKNV